MLVIKKKKQIRKKCNIKEKKEFNKEWWSLGGSAFKLEGGSGSQGLEVPHKVWRSHFYILPNVLRISLRNWLKSVSFLMNVFHTE